MVSEQAPAAEVEKSEAAAPAEAAPKAEQPAEDEAPVVEDVKEDEDDDDEDEDDDDDDDDAGEGNRALFHPGLCLILSPPSGIFSSSGTDSMQQCECFLV